MKHLKRLGAGLAALGIIAAISGVMYLLIAYPIYTVPFCLLAVAYGIGFFTEIAEED